MSEQGTSLDEFAEGADEVAKQADGENNDVRITGFQQLDTSPIEGWELKKLGEVLSFEYGDNLPSNDREDGSIPVYGSNGKVGTHSKPAIDQPGIVLGRKGSIGQIEFSNGPFWPIDTTYYVTQEETDENLRFIRYLLQNIQLERLNAASAIPGLNRNDAYGLRVLRPPLEEQRKIASVLYTVNQAIQKTEEIIDQTKRVQRGYIKERVIAQGSNSERKEGIVGTRRVKIGRAHV